MTPETTSEIGTETEPHLLPPDAALDRMRARIVAAARPGGRILVGLAGGPGVGKSTLAQRLVDALAAGDGLAAALVPMDGFHMRHDKLERLGLAAEKGASHTFEAQAFVDFLARVKTARAPISGPGYSRRIEDVVEDTYTIDPSVPVVVVEGNYLLLDTPPWSGVRPLLDLAIHLSAPRALVRERLLRRHAQEGLFTPERILAHVERIDLANFDRVAETRSAADLAITLDVAD